MNWGWIPYQIWVVSSQTGVGLHSESRVVLLWSDYRMKLYHVRALYGIPRWFVLQRPVCDLDDVSLHLKTVSSCTFDTLDLSGIIQGQSAGHFAAWYVVRLIKGKRWALWGSPVGIHSRGSPADIHIYIQLATKLFIPLQINQYFPVFYSWKVVCIWVFEFMML